MLAGGKFDYYFNFLINNFEQNYENLRIYEGLFTDIGKLCEISLGLMNSTIVSHS